MQTFIERISEYREKLLSMREMVIANILFTGQIPSPTFREEARAQHFLQRLAEFGVDECFTDDIGNPVGILHGRRQTRKPPVFLVAHLDTVWDSHFDYNYVVKEDKIIGPGLIDNSAGVGVLLTLPEIFKRLELTFNSDIVLAAPVQSIGQGNLAGIRHLVAGWKGSIRSAICLEGGELGRLNYFSQSMVRAEVRCDIPDNEGYLSQYKKNAILILNDVMDQILAIRLPQKPQTHINIGKIEGGVKHGEVPSLAELGFEIISDDDGVVQEVASQIQAIVHNIKHEYDVQLEMTVLSQAHASKLAYNHPLVKNALSLMEALKIKPAIESSESELSVFLSKGIPAVTLGLTHGDNYHQHDAEIRIAPLFDGILQLLGILTAIDNGVCDE
ncbi:MAG: hypothetical protein A2293_01265 [Elusimicrobia bacterium RIFOXYB2_FULL_49_7]|nr:MAG: hypothetical protein A2293_01265 [Elusimicrobia bacterium RIFOXYB2_FULL_49_7]